MTSDSKSLLAFAICDHLRQNIASKQISADDVEGIEVAIQCIGQAFGIDPEDATFSIKPANLMSIFEVFLKTQQKLKGADVVPAKKVTTAEARAKSDILKAEGNKKMAIRAFDEAIDLYSQAISFNENAVFYANRAAAYSQKEMHEAAAADGRKAIEMDAGYSKGYARLGHALYGLGNFTEAAVAYESGLKLEPDNASMKQSLALSLKNSGSVTPRSTPAPAPAGGMPNFGGMDIASMLSNPGAMDMGLQLLTQP